MSIAIQEQVDFLWKRILYGMTKTASSTGKFASGESIPSPLVVLPSSVWRKADTIPTTPPASTTAVVQVLTGASAVQMTGDPTSPPNVAWQACSTHGDLTTRMDSFIPPTFGVPYAVHVWIGNPNGGPAARILPDQTGEEWVYDYEAGVLLFTGTIPANKPATVGSGNVSVASNGVWIEAYRYAGAKGVGLDPSELPFIPEALYQLSDVELSSGGAPEGYVLMMRDGVWQAQAIPKPPGSLDQLTDVELSSAGATEGYVLTFHQGVWQAEPIPALGIGQLLDVNTGTVSDGKVLTFDQASGKWVPKSTAAALGQLTDVTLASLQAGDLLTFDAATNKWENKPASAAGAARFTDLLDTPGPGSYIGHQGWAIRVKQTADGLEYYQLPATIANFTDLGDVPHSYTGKATYILRVNSNGTALEFVPAPFVPTKLSQLSDVDEVSAPPMPGDVLTYVNGVWEPQAPTAGVNPSSLGTMAYQNADSVAITGGTISGVTIDGGTF